MNFMRLTSNSLTASVAFLRGTRPETSPPLPEVGEGVEDWEKYRTFANANH